jgi:glycogen synthase
VSTTPEDSKNNVAITLSRDEAVVLFEFLSRFTEQRKLDIADDAEERVLWNILADLESALAEPLAREYKEKLLKARERVRSQ